MPAGSGKVVSPLGPGKAPPMTLPHGIAKDLFTSDATNSPAQVEERTGFEISETALLHSAGRGGGNYRWRES